LQFTTRIGILKLVAFRKQIPDRQLRSRHLSKLILFAHPFSSYCQKVLTALYEQERAFECRMPDLTSPNSPVAAELKALWLINRMPLLLDDGRPVMESSIIIEHLELHHPGRVRLLPQSATEALEVRFLDRFFDQYVHTPMQKVVFDVVRAEPERDPRGVSDARAQLDIAYQWLENHLKGREWAAGEGFSLADCSAAPALFYADWVHPFADRFTRLRAYRARLNARPSFARAIDEARPYRRYFPPGAPDRD
jgi:glutathione S-transferase